MELPTVRTLWIGPRLGPVGRLCLKSFLHHGHRVELFTYGDIGDVPEGVSVEDGEAVLPLSRRRHRAWARTAHFADYFRWKLLHERGGYWIDADLLCLKPFDMRDEVVFGDEGYRKAAIGVLRFPARHPVLSMMLARCESPNRFWGYESGRWKVRKAARRLPVVGRLVPYGWGEVGGPRAFRQVLREHGLINAGKPFTWFYPVHYDNWQILFDDSVPGFEGAFQDTRAIHLWNHMLSTATDAGTTMRISPDSVVGRACRALKVDLDEP